MWEIEDDIEANLGVDRSVEETKARRSSSKKNKAAHSKRKKASKKNKKASHTKSNTKKKTLNEAAIGTVPEGYPKNGSFQQAVPSPVVQSYTADAAAESCEKQQKEQSHSASSKLWKLLVVLACLIAIVLCISIPLALKDTNNGEDVNPAYVSDNGDTSTLSTSIQCRMKAGCQALNSKAVTLNAKGFKLAILEYLKDPLSSPYGADINCWDVSHMTDMSNAFAYSEIDSPASDERPYEPTPEEELLGDPLFESFNEQLGCWDVSHVTSMRQMFRGASAFNQDISSWNVSSVVNMEQLFDGAASFNTPVGPWDVSSVSDTSRMFLGAEAFNQNIGSWDCH
ncbi:MAG: hypothetical protein SGARI_000358 [Bacillariaceae sp.]